MDGILTSIKKLLGIAEEYTHFDGDLIIHINSVFGILTQIGVGPATGFIITGASEEWSDFLSDATTLEFVKSYIYLKVKLIFDPPLGSAVSEAMNKMISELEWRISVAVDPGPEDETDDSDD